MSPPVVDHIVQIILIATGDLADYTDAMLEQLQATIASKIGVPADAVSISVAPASVRVTALITFPASIPPEDIVTDARNLLKDPVTASEVLEVMVVESIEYIGLLGAPRPPPSPRSPPVQPGGLDADSPPPESDLGLIFGLAVPLPLICLVVCCITIMCGRRHRASRKKRQLMRSDESGTAMMDSSSRRSRRGRSKVAVAPGPPPPASAPAFAAADANGSGALDSSEFAAALGMGHGTTSPSRSPALAPLAPLSQQPATTQALPQYQQQPLQPIQQRAPAPAALGALPPVAARGNPGQAVLAPLGPLPAANVPRRASAPLAPIAPPPAQPVRPFPANGSGHFAIANDSLPSLTQTREQARVD
jgi:hypothetical protein